MAMGKLDQAFFFQQQAMNLRTYRQQMIASNIANADTPYYKARDIDFGSALSDAVAGRTAAGSSLEMRQTAARHLPGVRENLPATTFYRNEFQSAVDGNTVEMDIERANFADNAIRYEASVNFVTQRFKSLVDAMQSPRG